MSKPTRPTPSAEGKQLSSRVSPTPNEPLDEVTTEYEDVIDAKEEVLAGWQIAAKYMILGLICVLAFAIRLFAVTRYESVIHEFDPYFNFRTTKYLTHEGFLAFLNWFDDRGWYPLGRTIGGTIYPGLMLTAASLSWVLNIFHLTVNIRNICVFLAPLFAANTAIATYLLTEEVTKRSSTGLLAAAFAAIVPSYISRSVGGSYDNEGVAIFALVYVFYLWVKAVNTGSMAWAAACALSYYYMVAAWGGYVFIINIIPIYVTAMVLSGRYSARLHIAYSVFYVLGSLLAMTVPFVGFNVVNQAECAASHGVFVAIQAYAAALYLHSVVGKATFRRVLTTVALAGVGAVACALIYLQISGKVQWSGRSLTLLDPTYASKYIPIIASVSEHQPTTWTSFFFDLHILVPLAPVGLFMLYNKMSDGAMFLILYGTLAWYFAGVMVRLMLTLAPIACILAAVGLSTVMQRFSAVLAATIKPAPSSSSSSGNNFSASKGLAPGIALVILAGAGFYMTSFGNHASYVSSMAYSSPSIVIDAGRQQDGSRVLFDDYREAYFWLRQNTDEHAKILSWWDYGYQMSAMANRSVLVDNNTWNNTHIATVGRALASTEENAYAIFDSLDVDYVLVIFGGLTGYSSDDINKFLWPVRIGSGVFGSEMPSEKDFMSPQGGFDIGPGGSKTLQNCVAYKLCYYRFGEMQTDYGKPAGFDRARNREVGVKKINLSTMEEAFTSEHWIVRIYKVKPRPTIDALPSVMKKRAGLPAGSEKAATAGTASTTSADIRPVGCFTSESAFLDKTYGGGSAGANLNLAVHHAKAHKKRFVAVARGGTDGHSFSFGALDPKTGRQYFTQGGGCERPCLDDANAACGCSDAACTGPKPEGEDNNRRWMVYEVLGGGAAQ